MEVSATAVVASLVFCSSNVLQQRFVPAAFVRVH